MASNSRVQIGKLMSYAIDVQNKKGYSSPSEALRAIIKDHKDKLGAKSIPDKEEATQGR